MPDDPRSTPDADAAASDAHVPARPDAPAGTRAPDPATLLAHDLDVADLEAAERVLLLDYRADQRRLLTDALAEHRLAVLRTREAGLAPDLEPAFAFSALPSAADPVGVGRAADPAGAPGAAGAESDPGVGDEAPSDPASGPTPVAAERAPRDAEHATGLTVAELGAALRAGTLTSLALTEAYLARIERFDERLRAFVTPLPERARAEARRADEELAAGVDRGPLHGIPYAAKDLLAVPGAPTTWGAAPYRDRWLEGTATVVERLHDAGAVLLGKASLGALAMGDVWFGGTTRNPWNPEEGSSGSSAGSAAAVAAGLAAFAIGSETMGSILSPAGRCSVVGLRPTYGRVSRHGAMALSWTLDKLGPLARSVDDAARVLAAVAGPDPRDATAADAPFAWDPAAGARSLRVGVTAEDLARPDAALGAFLASLAELGIEPTPVELPDLPDGPVMTILMVEASAAFDELIREGGADALTRQDADAWPNLLRAARLVSATEYVQAQRLRRRIQTEMAALLGRVDVLATRNDARTALRFGNAAGLPAVSLPVGRGETGRPLGNVALLAGAFAEDRALTLARAVEATFEPLALPPAFAARGG